MLSITGLDAGYGDVQVLEDVDLDVAEGEYVAVIGPNGAGKSTLMKSVFGLTDHMGGDVRIREESIAGLEPQEIIRYGINYVPQRNNVFPPLTVEENLRMGAYIRDGVPEGALRRVFEYFPLLEERRSQKAGTLSGGQRQMLALGRVLMLDPDLLLLDEPSAGLAPDLVTEIFDRIDAIHRDGTAVLIVEQNATEVLRRCERAFILSQGRNHLDGPGEELLADDTVRREFLGAGAAT
jgi:branched-chain amino acid transport system ATP-binding protein